MPEAIFLIVGCNGNNGNSVEHMHTVSFSCLENLTHEEVLLKCLRLFVVDGCHGNYDIHMCTMFYFHAYPSLQI